MTIPGKIVSYLTIHPEGVDDDALTVALGLGHRQQVNQECRRLQAAGIVERRRLQGKIRNFLVRPSTGASENAPAPEPSPEPAFGLYWLREPWYWEGNVQAVVVGYLTSRGFRIEETADTRRKERGKDIVAASPAGQELWVTVKGQPEGTPRTSKYLMARHYFADALRDLISWRAESQAVSLALALPDFVTYRNQTLRVASELEKLRGSVMWVFENRKVEAPSDFL